MYPQHLDEATWLRIRVLLAFQKALLGEVTQNLRAVGVTWTDTKIEGICYYDEEPTDDELDRMSDIETEIIAAFPQHKVSVRTQKELNKSEISPLMTWAFLRAE